MTFTFALASSPSTRFAKAWASTPSVRATQSSRPEESFRWRSKAHSKTLNRQKMFKPAKLVWHRPRGCDWIVYQRLKTEGHHHQGSPRAAFSFGANMKSMNLFAQIAKIDESKHEVWGVATAEIVDKEGEIFDYQSSKPYFKRWSDEISKATDGKSLGNVREMHVPSAVGKLVAIAFDDDLKQIRVGARIVDSVAWQKCMLGVYTGFSIGGAYVKSWKDGDFIRFTANPVEISVVDNPCVPGAHFTAVKADGTSEVRKFSSKDVRTEQAFKIGARHSKATRAHLDAIKACMDKMAQSHQEAETHMNALLDDGAADNAARSASAEMQKDRKST